MQAATRSYAKSRDVSSDGQRQAQNESNVWEAWLRGGQITDLSMYENWVR